MNNCPSCDFEYTYEEEGMMVCSSCQFKWSKQTEELIIKDSVGNILHDGDNVLIIKDLKVKGAASDLKQGMKVTNIRLVDEEHNISCKIPGFGQMGLKSEFVKKI